MKTSGVWLRRQSAAVLLLLIAMPSGKAATTQPEQTTAGQQAVSSATEQAQPQGSESGGTKPNTDPIPSGATPESSSAPPSKPADQNPLPDTSQSVQEQQQNGASNPVGTAAAPYEKSTGVAASRPAGAVIAPAKQRRARSILIKVGLLVGAAVAIGTVAALSHASPSRPH